MSFEITGQVVSIGALQSREWEGETFTNRSIIISVASGDQGQYLNHAEFDVAEAQFDFLDRNKIGDTVLIRFSLGGGKPYTNKKSGQLSVFNKLRAFYIGNESQEPANDAPQPERDGWKGDHQPGESGTVKVPNTESANPVETPKFNTEAEDQIPF